MARNPTISYKIMLGWMQEILAEYSEPITLRQLYYQLVARQKIGNNDGYYKKTSRDLTTARENGDIDPSKIEDRGRESSDGDYWNDRTAEEFIQVSIRSLSRKYLDYDFPRWVGQPNYVEVWCEKDALRRIMEEIAGKYGVVVSVGKGFTSFTHANDTTQRFVEQQDLGKDCKLLYFGDFDPSGEDMVRDLIGRIHEYGADEVTIQKCALTKAQVIEYNLPSDYAKAGDPRSKKFIEKNGNICVELDALRPDLLRSMIDTAIQTSINPQIWNDNIDSHERERAKIKTWCEQISLADVGGL